MKKPRIKKRDKTLHINLPQPLIAAITKEAQSQYRTTASLIRQVLAEKFEKVA